MNIILLRQIGLVLGALVLLGLVGCTNLSSRWDTQGYTVKSGDTLYSIAWRYEKDFNQIAKWNAIKPPYAIYPGQRLTMQAANKNGTTSTTSRPQILVDSSTGAAIVIGANGEDLPAASVQSVKRRHVVVKKYDTLYGIAGREGYSHHQIARWNHLKAPYRLRPGQTLRLSPPSASLGKIAQSAPLKTQPTPITTPIRHINRRAVPIATASSTLPRKVDTWQWPVKGRVIQTFKSNTTNRKGIDISGRMGQSIKSAAAGKVVYSGNGLINYGNLVIIKHSHSFLSAYAYNKSLSVKEGELVKQGQVIAKMGKHDSSKAQLHFEIRRNGKPVNPLHYLPKS